MGITMCETKKAEFYPIFFFFFHTPHSRNVRKSVTIRYQIRLLFRFSDHGISRRDISTFKSLLVRLFYIYSRYVHLYIRVYVRIHFPHFVLLAQLFVHFCLILFRVGIPLMQSCMYLEDTNRRNTLNLFNKSFYRRSKIYRV